MRVLVGVPGFPKRFSKPSEVHFWPQGFFGGLPGGQGRAPTHGGGREPVSGQAEAAPCLAGCRRDWLLGEGGSCREAQVPVLTLTRKQM